ncbi:hypothetical protein Tco_0799025 [Tanacetum coccineum]
MGCLPRSACLRSLCLTRPRIYWSMGNVWRSGTTNCGTVTPSSTSNGYIYYEIWPGFWDYSSRIWKNLGYSEWSTPAGLKLARENLQSRVKEEDSITDVENAIFDLGVMDSLCFLLKLLTFLKLPRGTTGGPIKVQFTAAKRSAIRFLIGPQIYKDALTDFVTRCDFDIRIARIVKNSRAYIFIKSFTSSASFWESSIQI